MEIFSSKVVLPTDAPVVRLLLRRVDDSYGRYYPDVGPKGGSIYIDPRPEVDEHRALYVLHELAHYMDLHIIGPGGSWSSLDQNGPLAPVLGAAAETRSVERWAADPLADYLLSPPEIWARSFSQWLCLCAGTKTEYDAAARHEHHWPAGEFASVADAVDQIARSMPWSV